MHGQRAHTRVVPTAQILVRWDGADENGEPWADSWEPWENLDNVSDLRDMLMKMLRAKKKKAAESTQPKTGRNKLGAGTAAPNRMAAPNRGPAPQRRNRPRGVKAAADKIIWIRDAVDESVQGGTREVTESAFVGDTLEHDLLGGSYTLLAGVQPWTNRDGGGFTYLSVTCSDSGTNKKIAGKHMQLKPEDTGGLGVGLDDKVECPLCAKLFHRDAIHPHAAKCKGKAGAAATALPSIPPLFDLMDATLNAGASQDSSPTPSGAASGHSSPLETTGLAYTPVPADVPSAQVPSSELTAVLAAARAHPSYVSCITANDQGGHPVARSVQPMTGVQLTQGLQQPPVPVGDGPPGAQGLSQQASDEAVLLQWNAILDTIRTASPEGRSMSGTLGPAVGREDHPATGSVQPSEPEAQVTGAAASDVGVEPATGSVQPSEPEAQVTGAAASDVGVEPATGSVQPSEPEAQVTGAAASDVGVEPATGSVQPSVPEAQVTGAAASDVGVEPATGSVQPSVPEAQVTGAAASDVGVEPATGSVQPSEPEAQVTGAAASDVGVEPATGSVQPSEPEAQVTGAAASDVGVEPATGSVLPSVPEAQVTGAAASDVGVEPATGSVQPSEPEAQVTGAAASDVGRPMSRVGQRGRKVAVEVRLPADCRI